MFTFVLDSRGNGPDRTRPHLNTRVVRKPLAHNDSPISKGCWILSQLMQLIPKTKISRRVRVRTHTAQCPTAQTLVLQTLCR